MSQMYPPSYEQPPADFGGKLKPPAICLIVVGSLSILFWAWNFLTAVLQLAGIMSTEPVQFGDQTIAPNPGGGLVLAVAILAANIAIVLGAVKMIKQKAWGLALTASILAVIPCISPCCVIGIPFGIWAIVVLINADVKASFS